MLGKLFVLDEIKGKQNLKYSSKLSQTVHRSLFGCECASKDQKNSA